MTTKTIRGARYDLLAQFKGTKKRIWELREKRPDDAPTFIGTSDWNETLDLPTRAVLRIRDEEYADWNWFGTSANRVDQFSTGRTVAS